MTGLSRERPRVGVDARFAAARYDGVGRYVACLLHQISVRADAPELLLVQPAETQRHALPSASPGVGYATLPAAPESPLSQLAWPWLTRHHRCDLWHIPFPLVPVGASGPLVVTVHDCIPERFPAYFGRVRRCAYRASVRSAVRRSRLILTVSAMTAHDVQRYYGASAQQLRVIPLGVDAPRLGAPQVAAALRGQLGVRRDYVLAVGRPRPHKNYRTLVQAMARLAPAERPLLVRVGRPDPRLPDGHEEEARRLGVELLGLTDVDDAALQALYAGAALVALPSLIEGFGLPLLEAMAAGAPVLAADIEPLRTSGGEVARYVDGDEQAWSEALQSALSDSSWRAAAAAAGPTQARRFPWSETGRRTVEAYREAIG